MNYVHIYIMYFLEGLLNLGQPHYVRLLIRQRIFLGHSQYKLEVWHLKENLHFFFLQVLDWVHTFHELCVHSPWSKQIKKWSFLLTFRTKVRGRAHNLCFLYNHLFTFYFEYIPSKIIKSNSPAFIHTISQKSTLFRCLLLLAHTYTLTEGERQHFPSRNGWWMGFACGG